MMGDIHFSALTMQHEEEAVQEEAKQVDTAPVALLRGQSPV